MADPTVDPNVHFVLKKLRNEAKTKIKDLETEYAQAYEELIRLCIINNLDAVNGNEVFVSDEEKEGWKNVHAKINRFIALDQEITDWRNRQKMLTQYKAENFSEQFKHVKDRIKDVQLLQDIG